jgi:hypothetical protein
VPKLDPSFIAWDGHSLGGMMGTMTTAAEPHIRATSLHVPGGGFIQLLAPNSARLHGLIQTLAKGLYAPVSDAELDSFHPLIQVMATATEAGDPLVFADALAHPFTFAEGPRPAPNVLISFSLDDEIMPNVTTHALVRALGATLIGPHLGSIDDVPTSAPPLSATNGLLAANQWAPSTHALGFYRHDQRQFLPGFPRDGEDPRFPTLKRSIIIDTGIREHDAQVVHFLTTALAGKPEAIVTRPAAADFDADGVLDADEVAQGTDPYDPESH